MKQKNAKAKPQTQATHPETRHSRPKTGAPGSESSKAQSKTKDIRNVHDKDGNSQQHPR